MTIVMPTATTSSTELCDEQRGDVALGQEHAAGRGSSASTAHIAASTPAIAQAFRSTGARGARLHAFELHVRPSLLGTSVEHACRRRAA